MEYSEMYLLLALAFQLLAVFACSVKLAACSRFTFAQG
jgi:hypothetical protein